MTITVADFTKDYKELFETTYVSDYTDGTTEQQYHALRRLVAKY